LRENALPLLGEEKRAAERREKPGFGFGFVTELMAFGSSDIEGVLGQIPRVRLGAGQAHGEAVKRLVVFAYERFELFGGMVWMHDLCKIALVKNPREIFS